MYQVVIIKERFIPFPMEAMESGGEGAAPIKSLLQDGRGHGETDLDEPVEESQSVHNNVSNRPHYIYYFKIFFDVGYFLLVIPFRLKLKYDRTLGKKVYKLHINRLQQVTCATIQAIVVFELFSIMRLIPSFKEMHKKPLNILQSGNLVASLLYTLALIYILWFKKRNIEDICEQLQEVDTISDSGATTTSSQRWKRIQVKLLANVICIAAYLLAMTHPVIHEAFVFEVNLASFFERMLMQAKACFLMTDPNFMNAQEYQFHFHDWRSIPAFLFTCIHTLILVPSAVLVHMLDLFALLTTICCWDIMKNFMRKCREIDQSVQMTEEVVPTIIVQYVALKKFFKTVNKGVGLLFLCCIGISLPMYATWIAVQLFNNTIETFDAIHFYIYFVTFLFVLSMAARINQRANEFYEWIGSSELHGMMPNNKMIVLMMDLYSNRISLSGCGLFVINFRFLVTIMSIIVTYTSIIIQFQISRGEQTFSRHTENVGNSSNEVFD